MDLGATVCLARRPHCMLCPLAESCVARREGRPEAYPVKTRKRVRGRRENWWLWLEHDGAVWLQQRPEQGVWAGLWSLPLFDDEAALDAAAAALGIATEALPTLDHALTHFDWRLHPRRAVLAAPQHAERQLGAGRWVARNALSTLGLPAPLAKLLAATSPAPSAPA
jgi:A/G-specific adenine glycosylase